jgi:hypothetical protein
MDTTSQIIFQSARDRTRHQRRLTLHSKRRVFDRKSRILESGITPLSLPSSMVKKTQALASGRLNLCMKGYTYL